MAPRQTYTQDELIVLIRQRDQKAFSYLYDNYAQALFGVVNAVLNDTEESEDVIQQAFVKIWNYFDSYDAAKGRLYTWMLNIARNLAIDSKRSKYQKLKSKIQSGGDAVYERSGPAIENTAHEAIGVKGLLAKLNQEQQQIIELAYFEGYTQEEIARKLNMPLGTVKTRIRQAMMSLRGLDRKEFTK